MDVIELSEEGVFEIPSPPKLVSREVREGAFAEVADVDSPVFDRASIPVGDYQAWLDNGLLYVVIHPSPEQGLCTAMDFADEHLNIKTTKGHTLRIPTAQLGAVNGATIKQSKVYHSDGLLVLVSPM